MDESALQVHRCNLCQRRYKRLEHLKRHYASHDASRPHICNFCSRGFQRSDALRRHLRNCSHQEIQSSRSSTKRRACDRCIRMKRACNSAHPCQTCLDKGVDCFYTASDLSSHASNKSSVKTSFSSSNTNAMSSVVTTNGGLFGTTLWADLNDPDLFDFSNTTWSDFLNLPSAESMTEDSTSDHQFSLRFLDNFTKYTGFVNSFDCGTFKQRQKVLEIALQQNMTSGHLVQPTLLEKRSTMDPLAVKSLEIVALIKEVSTNKPRNSSVNIQWSDLLDDSCSSFFSPMNLQRYIELYWSVWHPNVNLVHRPTFDPISSKPSLIAAMVIIGACVSPDVGDRELAATWFNAVEEIVFIDDDFCDDTTDSIRTLPSISKIQSLQAAYMVCLYQNWEGDDKSRRRIRRHRFSTLVAVARDIGIDNATHANYNKTGEDKFDWLEFAAKEQLIRVFLWTFLLDTAFVIFNNLPPRMVIREMKMSSANCEAVFQASTAYECYSLLTASMDSSGHSNILLHDTIEKLCASDLEASFRKTIANLGPLNLFVITSALHSMIFQHQNFLGYEGQLIPLRNALENWKLIWTQYMDEYANTSNHSPLAEQEIQPENMWRRVGFMKHASEYWLLASLILDRIEASTNKQIVESQMPGAQLSSLYGSTTQETTNPVLRNYDETSMRQVNDLIADLRRTSLG